MYVDFSPFSVTQLKNVYMIILTHYTYPYVLTHDVQCLFNGLKLSIFISLQDLQAKEIVHRGWSQNTSALLRKGQEPLETQSLGKVCKQEQEPHLQDAADN